MFKKTADLAEVGSPYDDEDDNDDVDSCCKTLSSAAKRTFGFCWPPVSAAIIAQLLYYLHISEEIIIIIIKNYPAMMKMWWCFWPQNGPLLGYLTPKTSQECETALTSQYGWNVWRVQSLQNHFFWRNKLAKLGDAIASHLKLFITDRPTLWQGVPAGRGYHI